MKQVRLTHKRHELKPADWHGWLAEVMPIGAETLPERVVGWSKRGKFTRVEAHYADSHRIDVHFKADGLTVSSCKARYRGVIGGKSGTVIIDEAADFA